MKAEKGSLTAGWQLLLLAAAFFLPVLIAGWLYFAGREFAPEGRTNHGALLEPIVNLGEAVPGSPTAARTGQEWLLVYVHERPCEASCRDALHRLRQSRLMLGPDMDRVQRVFLHGREPPDRVFLEREHPGLAAFEDPETAALLAEKRPRELQAGGLYLVDPLGNLVMYFPPDLAPRDMVDDVEHLLDVSRIG
jgi:hypothetical protein